MRRSLAIVAAVTLVPLVAWTAVSADTPPDEVASAPAEAPAALEEEPAAAEPEPETTAAPTTSTTSTTTTTTLPVDPNASTTTVPVDPNATTTTVVDPNATTTTAPVDPNATTTTVVDPDATTTTVVDPNATVPPADTTVAPPPVEDIESEPVEPPVEVPSGRVVVPAGAFESGLLRPVTFPVAGPIRYANDWGACRDGCARAHKGNDLIGDRRQPILAMHDGVIDHLIDHPTAGYGVAIRDDEGWRYDVYHMNNDSPGTDDASDDGTWRFLPGIVNGARVTAGQQIGWMGDSGNSEGSVPHAHVEIHTPDGTAINPYWSLRAAQRAANCAVGVVGEPEPAPAGVAVEPEAAPVIGATTQAAASPADVGWMDDGWAGAVLPAGWSSYTVTGGQPNSGGVAARFWVSPVGYTPVDAAALRVGDARYDEGVDCAAAPDGPAVAPIPAELAVILATIRQMETGGNYSVTVTTSTASGAYGFLDGSWGGFGGYARAKDAPPAVQDAKAAELATYILGRNGGDVSTIPVSWYIGHVPRGAEWDTVPPVGGNKITPREYQRRWLNTYSQLLGNPGAYTAAGGNATSVATVDTSATCRTVVIDVGTPDAPQFALTQAQSFLADDAGRAVPDATDPCDLGRVLTAAAPPGSEPSVDLAAEELAAKLEAPIALAGGR